MPLMILSTRFILPSIILVSNTTPKYESYHKPISSPLKGFNNSPFEDEIVSIIFGNKCFLKFNPVLVLILLSTS